MPPKRKGRAPGGRNPKRSRMTSSPPPPYPDDSDIPEHIQHRHQYGGIQAKLDLSKPPIYKLDDIFRSITDHAVGVGFKDFMEYMGSTKLRVATACSGTECPLLALEMVQRFLKEKYKLHFEFEHLFSTEIVPFKQAFIERNFNPPVIFRDVSQLKDEEAQTAYGSLKKVPKDVDIMIAGFACVDFSNLNNKRKPLEDCGESGDTLRAIIDYSKSCRPRMVILENVMGCPWDKVADAWYDIGYLALHVKADTKDFYIPQTRVRGYMFCIDNVRMARQTDLKPNVLDLWQFTFDSFKRPASSPAGMFLLAADDRRLEQIEADIAIRILSGTYRTPSAWEEYAKRHISYRKNKELGHARPISKFGANFSCQLPDFAWHTWARSQPERVWDTLDINFLRRLQGGHDINFKERFIDLSQGVGREEDNRPWGIVGCITPCGIPFSTTRGGPLCGRECLALQGLPLDRLLLTREKERDLQNLAGNAMSSTVVGSAILSALIVGYKLFDRGQSPPTIEEPKQTASFVKYDLAESDIQINMKVVVNLEELKTQGAQTARYCPCERQSGMRRNILMCTECDHTACSACARNPAHNFEPASNLLRSPPLPFISKLKNILPTRLVVLGISEQDYDKFKSDLTLECSPDTWSTFLKSVMQTVGDELRFSDIRRSEFWTVVYDGKHSALKLVINATSVNWLLFAKPAESEPVSSLNRIILDKPIARMTPVDSIFSGVWQVCAPLSSKREMTIYGTGARVASYEQVCGLQDRDHKDGEVWSELVVTGRDEDVIELDADIRGTYERLERCGMANATLHKKKATLDVPAVYLFLDPTKYGDPDGDMFVFSFEHERISGYESRSTIAQVTHEWRSADVTNQAEPVNIYHRRWRKVDAVLEPYGLDVSIECQTLKAGTVITIADVECHQSNVPILSFSAPAAIIKSDWQKGPWKVIDSILDPSLETRFSWMVQRAAGFSGFQEWNRVENSAPLNSENHAPCASCAPQKPRILWTRVNKQIKGYEHPHDAGQYERLIKAKPPPFHVFHRVDENNIGRLLVTLNIQTLLHQAYDKLIGPGVDNGVSFSWRLVPNAYSTKAVLPKFNFIGNQGCPQTQPPGFKVELRPEQQRSLFWMKSQEEGVDFEEEEVEEAFLPLTAWRAEGKATVQRKVRGGVVADEVGYGKTAISLGLISANSDEDKQAFHVDGFIPSTATLIVVPETLIDQWRDEIQRFTNIKHEDILVFKAKILAKTKVSVIKGARIIIIPLSLFANEPYYNGMRKFTGMPDVPSNAGRNFDHWFMDALLSLKNLVKVLMDEGPEAMLSEINRKHDEVDREERQFKYEPSKRYRGEAYVKAKKRESNSESAPEPEANNPDTSEDEGEVKLKLKRPDSSQAEGSSSSQTHVSGSKGKGDSRKLDLREDFNIGNGNTRDNIIIPVLHAFSFSRIIIDEFTYIDKARLDPFFALQARTKWILSGTPAQNDFGDVSTMARFLGVHLGVHNDELSPGKRSRYEMDVEKFQAFKESHSGAWHLNRHSIAQRFLDRFACKNVAEVEQIPSTEHIIVVQQPPVERAIYLELHMRLMAERDVRSHGRDDMPKTDRGRWQNEILKNETPRTALVKRGAVIELNGWTNKEPAINTLESLIALRKAKASKTRRLFEKEFRKATLDCCDDKQPEELYLLIDDIDGNSFGNRALCSDVFRRIEQFCLLSEHGNDDLRNFFKDRLESTDSGGSQGETPSAEESDSLMKDSETEPFAEDTESESESDDDDNFTKRNYKCSAYNPNPKSSKKSDSPKLITVEKMRRYMKQLVQQAGEIKFVESVGLVLRGEIIECDACNKQPKLGDINILDSCGHILCEKCILMTAENGHCAVVRCGGLAKGTNMISGTDIGRWEPDGAHDVKMADAPTGNENNVAGHCDHNSGYDDNQIRLSSTKYGGSKMDKLVEIIQATPADEKVLLFIQFPDIIDLTSEALKLAGITHNKLIDAKRWPSRDGAAFQKKVKVDKVLILTLGTEASAGLNLQYANHIIFLSPAVSESQYEYEASMCQAIGRSRRFGQTKHVHIYHLLANKTIDVQIYQERRGKVLIERDGEAVLVARGEATDDELKNYQGPVFDEACS